MDGADDYCRCVNWGSKSCIDSSIAENECRLVAYEQILWSIQLSESVAHLVDHDLLKPCLSGCGAAVVSQIGKLLLFYPAILSPLAQRLSLVSVRDPGTLDE